MAIIHDTASIVYMSFIRVFGEKPLIVRSPGRINLIGEHTDYNEGFVLPASIDKAIYMAARRSENDTSHFISLDLNEEFKGKNDQLKKQPGHWSVYINGVIDQLQKAGHTIPAFNCVFSGNIPLGAGMSSSAALECAVIFLLNHMFDLQLSRKEMALLAQRAENEFAGVNCGIMDQFANMMGSEGKVIQLDCRSLEYTYRPFNFPATGIVLFDTGVKHSLASSEYNTRRLQCEEGVTIIQKKHPAISSLRDADLSMVEECLATGDTDIYKRCRYVVSEIKRLQEACADLDNNDIGAFGQKMYQTHEGLQHDYEVSCRELDFLVETVRQETAVSGARMMGGGFGGCTINLIDKDSIPEVTARVAAAYQKKYGVEPCSYITNIEEGTGLVDM